MDSKLLKSFFSLSQASANKRSLTSVTSESDLELFCNKGYIGYEWIKN